MKKIFERHCPICDKIIFHTRKYNRDNSIKKQIPCRSCSAKKQIKKFGNPMQGRSIFDIWIEKYGKEKGYERKNQWLINQKNAKRIFSKEARKKISETHKGEKNHMKNSSLYELMVKKYGEKEAKIRYQKTKEKLSKANSGKNNPMYGKPSPKGSGNGWSGWYKDMFFRSLGELSYMIYLIENNISFELAEIKKYRVSYTDYKGDERTYHPDFYLHESQEIVEVKPKRLLKATNNKLKFKAAKKQFGNKFIIVTEDDVPKLSEKKIYNLYINKEIKFTERYEKKYKEKYNGKFN